MHKCAYESPDTDQGRTELYFQSRLCCLKIRRGRESNNNTYGWSSCPAHAVIKAIPITATRTEIPLRGDQAQGFWLISRCGPKRLMAAPVPFSPS